MNGPRWCTAAAVVLAAAVAMPVTGVAQWLRYPTADVPRARDGTPNLNAPAPRLPDGKPDFSGIWQSGRKVACTPDMSKFVECGNEIGGSPLALNIGTDMPGGLPYQPWAAAVHTPRLLVLLNEVSAMYRQIFVDGRPLLVDPNPSWNGYSTATWEGDTLVVRTNGFRDGLWLDMAGSPMTDAAIMTERFRRPNYGTLEIQITIDDKKAYTRPWTVEMPQTITLDTELIDEICLENEKSSQRMRGQ
jgi:hypothetical protein